MIDGGLRAKLIAGIPRAHWQAVETAAGQGVPDANGCLGGVEFWVECKRITGGSEFCDHPPTPEQVAWLERRERHGGRTFVAIRRYHAGGPRLGQRADTLYLMRGSWVRTLLLDGISACRLLGTWEGGAARWRWSEIEKALVS